MRNFDNQRLVKSLLLAGCAGSIAMAGPALAQQQQEPVITAGQETGAEVLAEPASSTESARIVVTGSRIQRRDFEANSPIVTIDESLLEQSSTAAIESNLNRLPQFTPAQTPTQGGDIQPTATNTPGAATISLRGIGANRNLVLLDGRRATPGNATGVVDISTIPSAAIERVEIISGGASATYGADAVAGVTNFILKKNFQGLELDAQSGISQEGDGFEYQLSGIMGTDFDDGRGNISIAMSMNTREASYQRDREWYQDLWTDPSVGGSQFFLDSPGVIFGFGTSVDYSSVFDDADPAIPAGSTVFFNNDGTAFTSSFAARGGVDRFNGDTTGLEYKVTDAGTLVQNNTDTYLILPLTRYNGFFRGDYEINDSIGVFAQGLFSHVETYTRTEPGPITTGWGVNIDPDGLDRDQLPQELWTLLESRTRAALPGEPGYNPPTADNPFPTQPVVSAAGDPFELTSLLPENRETFTDVQTYTLIAGLEGSIPGTDLTWEAFVNHGESSTFAQQTGIYSLERLQTVLQAPNFGQGFQATGNQEAPNYGFGAATATCTSGLNFFQPPEGGFSEDCLDAISADLKNRSTVRQTIAEGNLQGGLFDLPAGTLRFAAGVSYRELDYEFLNDTLTTQGASFIDQAVGIYPSGDSEGFFDVRELYGELLIPVLADIPFIQEFTLELGGRMSDYSTTGTSYTYKILGDLAVTDWLRFRGGYNRAERAPNIAELFLAPQQTFAVNTAGDPCSLANPLSFTANPATNPNAANVEATCRILMEQSGNSEADEQYYSGTQDSSTFGFAFPTLLGNEALEPETADTWTAGVVLRPSLGGGIRSRLTVDWFKISVKDAIGAQSAGIALRQCFDEGLNPLIGTDPVAAANSVFCQNVPRNGTGALGNVQTTYVNNGRFNVEGIDVAADFGFDVGPGTLNLNLVANYMLAFESAELSVLDLVDYVGTTGTTENGLNAGAYEYRILGTIGYNMGPAFVSLQWEHLPSVEDATEAQFGATPTTGYPAYNVFALNGSYSLTDDTQIRFGVNNLFNAAPPLGGVDPTADVSTGNLPGGSYNDLFYDTQGRRFYLGVNARF